MDSDFYASKSFGPIFAKKSPNWDIMAIFLVLIKIVILSLIDFLFGFPINMAINVAFWMLKW